MFLYEHKTINIRGFHAPLIRHCFIHGSRLDEMATLPSQKQTKTEDEQSYISSVPGIKEEVETPKKVIIPSVNIPDREDREPHKAVMEKGLVKKTVTLQDSPSPGPAAIPESPVSSPGEQKCQNIVGLGPPTGVKVEQMDMTDKKVCVTGCWCGITGLPKGLVCWDHW